MVGLIHKVLFDLIESIGGSEAVEAVRAKAGVDPDMLFRMDEAYDDTQWQSIYAATLETLELSSEEADEAFAAYFVKDALERWPMWFKMSSTAREFLERQPAIHNNFASSVQNSQAAEEINDKFHLEKHDDRLITHYRSPNTLCGFYKALARAILSHYGDSADIEEIRCMKNGDPECEIVVTWTAQGSQ